MKEQLIYKIRDKKSKGYFCKTLFFQYMKTSPTAGEVYVSKKRAQTRFLELTKEYSTKIRYNVSYSFEWELVEFKLIENGVL